MKKICIILAFTSMHLNAMHNIPSILDPLNKQPARDRALWHAAREGDLTKLNQHLEDGANPNYCHPGHGTPLHAAVLYFVKSSGHAPNCFHIVQMLMDSGAHINARDADGLTPLMVSAPLAYSSPHMARLMIKALLGHGAHSYPVDAYGASVFDRLKCDGKEIETIRRLIEEEAKNDGPFEGGKMNYGVEPMDIED